MYSQCLCVGIYECECTSVCVRSCVCMCVPVCVHGWGCQRTKERDGGAFHQSADSGPATAAPQPTQRRAAPLQPPPRRRSSASHEYLLAAPSPSHYQTPHEHEPVITGGNNWRV